MRRATDTILAAVAFQRSAAVSPQEITCSFGRLRVPPVLRINMPVELAGFR
jgi:hypothetical protein